MMNGFISAVLYLIGAIVYGGYLISGEEFAETCKEANDGSIHENFFKVLVFVAVIICCVVWPWSLLSDIFKNVKAKVKFKRKELLRKENKNGRN